MSVQTKIPPEPTPPTRCVLRRHQKQTVYVLIILKTFMKKFIPIWIPFVLYFILMGQYAVVESAPEGMMAFFKLSECPEGWEPTNHTQGRLIHSVTAASYVNLTLGKPLADLTIPTHSHNASGSTWIGNKGISTNFNQATFASQGWATFYLNFTDSVPNYPFVHMLLCKLKSNTSMDIPDGLIAFFDKGTCPPQWTPYSESVGRIMIPGSSQNGIVYSSAPPLSSQEDRLHTHTFNGSFSTSVIGLWSVFYNNWNPANPGTYHFVGTSAASSSNLPYIQLLTCQSGEKGNYTDLPIGIHMFYASGPCNRLPGNTWVDADSNITGHWIISLPENGTVGVPFGGQPWEVSSTFGRDGIWHSHFYSGYVTMPQFSMLSGGGGVPYVPVSSYPVSGPTDGGDLNMPYLSVPFCELGSIAYPPSPSPNPSSGGLKISATRIGVIVGVCSFLVLVAVLVAILVVRRRRQNGGWINPEKPEEHYTISVSMNSIQLDSSIAINNIEIKERLGGGNFGEVFKGLWDGTTPVALKKLKSKEQLQEFVQEAKILLSLNHPNIVRCHGIHTSPSGEHYIVMEYLSSGSLDNVLRREPNLQVGDLLIMAKHAAAGMRYLEQQRFVHRDLALRNLLVASDASSYTVKVSDFGLSRKIQQDGYYMKVDTQGVPIRWTAPEVFEKGIYTTKSDVWSFGITLWELFSIGQTPYPGMTNVEVMQQVSAGYRMACPRDCPEAIYALMCKCWDQSPEARPGFREIFDVIETVAKSYRHQSLQWADNQVPLVTNQNNTYNNTGAAPETYN